MNVFGLRVYYNNIHSYNYISCTYLWYRIYRKSGRRDGQTNNFCFFFILVMDQKHVYSSVLGSTTCTRYPHTYAEEWEVVGRQLCAFCARWILFKFITVVSHAPLCELFLNRGRMTTWLNIIIIIMKIILHWKNYWVVVVVSKCISAGPLERHYSIVPG